MSPDSAPAPRSLSARRLRRAAGPAAHPISRSRRPPSSRTSRSVGRALRVTTTSTTCASGPTSSAAASRCAPRSGSSSRTGSGSACARSADYGTDHNNAQLAQLRQLPLARRVGRALLHRGKARRLHDRRRHLRHAAARDRDVLGPRHPDAGRLGQLSGATGDASTLTVLRRRPLRTRSRRAIKRGSAPGRSSGPRATPTGSRCSSRSPTGTSTPTI